jgi:hypothetical protein
MREPKPKTEISAAAAGNKADSSSGAKVVELKSHSQTSEAGGDEAVEEEHSPHTKAQAALYKLALAALEKLPTKAHFASVCFV